MQLLRLAWLAFKIELWYPVADPIRAAGLVFWEDILGHKKPPTHRG